MITHELAESIVGTSFEDLTPEAIEGSKLCILNCLGLAIAAVNEDPAAKKVIEVIGKPSKDGEAMIIGAGGFANACDAAMLNGTLMFALGYCDFSYAWLAHPTVAILPAVMAVAEQQDLSGRDLLLGHIVAWEVGVRLSHAIRHNTMESGYFPSGTIGSIAAASGCARIMNLNTQQVGAAIGLGAGQGMAMIRSKGHDAMCLAAGTAARNGVFSASLAAKDFGTYPEMLSGPAGFLCMNANGQADEELVDTNIKNNFELGSPGPNIKLHDSCGSAHATIDAVFAIKSNNNLDLDNIEKVEVHAPPMLTTILPYNDPQTPLQAKESLPYAIATALLHSDARHDKYAAEIINQPKTQELMNKVQFVPMPDVADTVSEVSMHPHQVVIKTKDGATYSESVHFFRGTILNPASWEDVVDKFKFCTNSYLSQEAIEKVIGIVANLEEQDSLEPLIKGLL